jgi:hypothetical protein
MRLTPAVPIVLVLCGSPACARRPPVSEPPGDATAAAAEHLSEQPGAIVRVGDFGYGIVPDRDPGTRYAPDALPAEFRQDGLRVVFSGVLASPPPDVRLWGTPLKLKTIRRAR